MACVLRLQEIGRDSVSVLLDATDGNSLILSEYRRDMKQSPQPRAGYQFYKKIMQTGRFKYISITPRANPKGEDYEEFPDAPDLANFDPPDRKYVAVAIASQENPPILNATDTDWANNRVALERYVRIESLCSL